jgi:hypothetical protein
MTLSNFDWTDKDSVKWFILLPTGHEGPYSLKILSQLMDQKKLAANVKIWAEGLNSPVTLGQAFKSSSKVTEIEVIEKLPPIPEDEVPPLPIEEEEDFPPITPEELPMVKKGKNLSPVIFISAALLLMLFFIFSNLIKKYETFDIGRLPKMTLNLQQRILNENSFGGWDKKIFFKEYLPDDHTQIWLVTSSFQKCSVEATFHSIKDKVLSMKDENVIFKSQGNLHNHVVELSSFDFSAGNRIIPGLYELNIRAYNCEWDGVIPRVMNKFSGPDEEYLARTKVILFSKGSVEFNTILDKLIKKKVDIVTRELSQNELFWQDLQQKLETLQAVTLQIEQHLLDFLDEDSKSFKPNLKSMVDQYTRKFGSFLTSFVIENENYFKNLNRDAGASQKRNYELIVKLASKKIGLESMKFIEEFQSLKKNPSPKDLNAYSARVKKTFAAIKTDISEKIIQVSEDRSK